MKSDKRRGVCIDIAHNHREMLVAAKFGAEHDDFGILREAQRHTGPRRDPQRLCLGLDMAVDVAPFDQHDVVVVTKPLHLPGITARNPRHQHRRQQLGDPQETGCVIGE